MKIILASQSPRRKQLLEQAEIKFEIVVANTDESYPADLAVDAVPEFIARQKAEAVLQRLQAEEKWDNDTLIIAADTIVVLSNSIIGKPKDEQDAQHILRALSGQCHTVISGVYITNGKHSDSFHSNTKVHFGELSEAQIAHYISNYRPFDKAGAYAIQEWIGLVGITAIEGDIYNVIGLPVNKVIKSLHNFFAPQALSSSQT